MPRPSIYKNDPCDIPYSPKHKMMLFDAGLLGGPFYWNIHGKVVLIIKGRPDAIIAATPDAAIREAIDNGGL